MRTLLNLALGEIGTITGIAAESKVMGETGRDPEDLEGRLLDMGFFEGETVQILHFGPFGRDPLAVRVGEMVVALRRLEAQAILVGEPQSS